MKTSFNLTTEIARIIFLAFIVIIVAIIVRGSLLVLYDVSAHEQYVYTHKFLHDEFGISYYDPDLDVVYPNIIDFDKFNEERLDKLIDFSRENSQPSARLALYNVNDEKINDAHWHKEWYERNFPKATESRGRGGIRKYYKEIPVQYILEEKLYFGELHLTMVIPET